MTNLEFHPLAEVELNEAGQYYETASEGLGHDVLS